MRKQVYLNLKVLEIIIKLNLDKKISPTFLFAISIPIYPHSKESDSTIGIYHEISILDKAFIVGLFYGKYLLKFGVERFKPFMKFCDYFATGCGS